MWKSLFGFGLLLVSLTAGTRLELSSQSRKKKTDPKVQLMLEVVTANVRLINDLTDSSETDTPVTEISVDSEFALDCQIQDNSKSPRNSRWEVDLTFTDPEEPIGIYASFPSYVTPGQRKSIANEVKETAKCVARRLSSKKPNSLVRFIYEKREKARGQLNDSVVVKREKGTGKLNDSVDTDNSYYRVPKGNSLKELKNFVSPSNDRIGPQFKTKNVTFHVARINIWN